MKINTLEALSGYTKTDLTPTIKGRYVREVVIDGPVDLLVRTASVPTLTLYSKRATGATKVHTEFDGETLHISTESVTNSSRFGRTTRNFHGAVQFNYGRDIRVAGGNMYSDGELVSTHREGDHWVLVLAAPGPIESLQLRGSGDASLVDISAQTLTLAASGAGDIEASGQVDTLVVSVAGTGNVDTLEMHARHARLSIMGSGDIVAHASDSADAEVLGSGDIRVHGSPSTKMTTVLGTGSIRFK